MLAFIVDHSFPVCKSCVIRNAAGFQDSTLSLATIEFCACEFTSAGRSSGSCSKVRSTIKRNKRRLPEQASLLSLDYDVE